MSYLFLRACVHVGLKSTDPFTAPAININYFSDPSDMATLREGVRIARDIAAASPLAKYLSQVRACMQTQVAHVMCAAAFSRAYRINACAHEMLLEPPCPRGTGIPPAYARMHAKTGCYQLIITEPSSRHFVMLARAAARNHPLTAFRASPLACACAGDLPWHRH